MVHATRKIKDALNVAWNVSGLLRKQQEGRDCDSSQLINNVSQEKEKNNDRYKT
jgi:hypothetical protein